MPRNSEHETTTDIPRFLADEIRVLIERNHTPARNVAEYVRQALAKQVNDDKTRAAQGQILSAASSFAAEAALPKPRQGAADDQSPAPGNHVSRAVGAERGSVA